MPKPLKTEISIIFIISLYDVNCLHNHIKGLQVQSLAIAIGVIFHHQKQIENVVNQGLHNLTQVEYIPQQNQWHTSWAHNRMH